MSGRRVLVVRHGQSTWNAQRRWQGQADPPLSPLGEAQARSAVTAAAAHGPFAAVVTSTLRRAARTAEILAAGLGLPAPVSHAGLMERRAGEWEGLTRAEIDERYPGAVADWRTPPGFESDLDLLARIAPTFGRLAGPTTADPRPVLAVTHGGVMYTLESLHESRRHHGRIDNLDARWFEVRGDGPRDIVPLGDRISLADAVSGDELPPDYV